MAVIIPPGYANVVHKFSLLGDAEQMVVTMGVDVGDVTLFQAYTEALADHFEDAFPPSAMNASYGYNGVVLYRGQDGGPPEVYESIRNVSGSFTGAGALPNNCAFLVRKRTASAGRANRGRFYLPPFAVDETTITANGIIPLASLNAIQQRVTDWLLTPAQPYVVLHDVGSPVVTPTPIIDFVLDPLIATMRRRLRR